MSLPGGTVTIGQFWCWNCQKLYSEMSHACASKPVNFTAGKASGTIVYPENEALRWTIAEQRKEIESLKSMCDLWAERNAENVKEIDLLNEKIDGRDLMWRTVKNENAALQSEITTLKAQLDVAKEALQTLAKEPEWSERTVKEHLYDDENDKPVYSNRTYKTRPIKTGTKFAAEALKRIEELGAKG